MGSEKPLSSPFIFITFLSLMVFYQTHSATDHNQHCPSSSCGNINNISYPFRLETDPTYCGDLRYNLSCENNISTVLYLNSGKYYVQAINYNNYTIRVVDSNLHKGSCPSLSYLQPLTEYNFTSDFLVESVYLGSYGTQSNFGYYSDSYRTKVPRKSGRVWYRYSLSEPIIFFNCENPVKSPLYIPTAPCNNNSSRGINSYVKIGSTYDSELIDSCRIEMMVMITTLRGSQKRNNVSYSEILNELAYGFELSWLPSYGRSDEAYICYVDDSNKVHCPSCRDSWGLINTSSCGVLSVILAYVEGMLEMAEETAKLLMGIPCVAVLLIYKWRKRHLSMYNVIEEFLQSNTNLIPIRFSYSEIKRMTKGFKDKLGEGGYGTVYKGKLCSGHFVAVKMLGKSKANGQEFINEVATIGRIHHVNVVQLVGYCVERSKRVLIYDYMSNGSLDKYIFSQEVTSLDYKKMCEISLGIACGIEYLHQGCNMQILHFDIKPHNILLDKNFTPKVSDFGLARLCPLDNSIVSVTAARGTMGCIAPEMFYKNIGVVSNKADVYSFGMLLMEMASRRKNLNAAAEHTSQIYFPSWVYDQFNEGNDLEMGDATEGESKIRKKMIVVALWCIQMKPSDRPSINKVKEMLEGEVDSLQMPPKPFLCPQDKPVDDEGNKSSTRCSTIDSDDE
nr:LEAF RUST 10 DISEASE-RESISTANCE LOCUS RECEPTOR-LIKE PROTEIN KINASE-like 2.1 isoform X1 [Ziziphus jujuba var. spinosa]